MQPLHGTSVVCSEANLHFKRRTADRRSRAAPELLGFAPNVKKVGQWPPAHYLKGWPSESDIAASIRLNPGFFAHPAASISWEKTLFITRALSSPPRSASAPASLPIPRSSG